MNKKKVLLILIALVAIGISIFLYFHFKFSIASNDDNALGNTPGNLNNGGYFCEYNGTIYFANPYDEGKLYSMNSDCTNAQKLSNSHVASINVLGNYIYYVKNNSNINAPFSTLQGKLSGIYRCDLSGNHEVALSGKLTGIINLVGNTIYYQQYDKKAGFSLDKVNTNNLGYKQLTKTEVNPSSYYDKIIYYSNIGDNHNILTIDTSNYSILSYFSGKTNLVNMQGDYLYYIDEARDNALVRMSTSNQIVELLSSGRCINYNIYDNKIFYQKEGDDAGLYRMNLDGSNKEHIATGDFNNILCTSQYTFFQFDNNPGMLYRVSTTGQIKAIEEITIK